jgi:hypothetical protein
VGRRADGQGLVVVGGDRAALVDSMREPLTSALSGRRVFYDVRVAALGPRGDVLVSITASTGRIPLLFGPGELQAAHVSRVVRRAVDGAAVIRGG